VTARVLHVLEATIGGTKRHLLDLAPGLRAQGWDVEVACPRVRDEHHGDVSFWDDLARAGVPAHEIPMRRRPLNATNARAVGSLARLIRTGRYDVVHAQSSIAGALARPAVEIAALGSRHPKVVYSPHGFAFLSEEWGGRRGLFLRIERALGRFTDRLIAVSQTEKDQTVAAGIAPAERVAVVPNGVVSASIPATRRKIGEVVPELAAWEGTPIVGTISRMVPQKDPLTWVRVAARVRELVGDVRFVWIWGGDMEPEMRAEAAWLGLGDHIAFLGHRPDAREILSALDVFLLTSVFEGLPYSAIEALACGTPVVATDVTGTQDVVLPGESGLLAPAGDVEALAQHVASLLASREEARRLGRRGREDVLARFSVERMVERTADLYRELLHLPSPAR
jgi:glycosyltransferase involved in cell wall biosynthesis